MPLLSGSQQGMVETVTNQDRPREEGRLLSLSGGGPEEICILCYQT